MDEARTAFRQAAETSVSFPDKEEAKRQLSLLGDTGTERTQVLSDEVVLKKQSEDPSAQVRLGESYEKQGAFAEAAASYEEAIELNPNLLLATAKLAELYAGPLQDHEKALKFARKARELAPNDPKIIAILGSVAYQIGNFTWAYSLLQESSRQLPSNPEILHQLAWSAYSLGKVNEAWQAMESILAAAPDSIQSSDAKLFLEMAALSEEGANPVAAEPQVEQVLKANPGYVPALMARAAILLERGESERAAAIYSEILCRLPNFTFAQKCLGSLYAANPDKREQAHTLLMKARMASPEDPELAQVLAKLSYDRKEYAYAVQLLQESAKKKPLESEFLYYLGMSYRQVNEQAQGEDALQRALEAGLREPHSRDAKRVLAEIREGH
jgi:tetratricopeptide (TPR) repeat protein